jgi:branched-chain amino acid transport system substrate-binding protein
MQDAPAYMDPASHHLQQSTYIATWRPKADHPERGIETLGHIPPEPARYERETATRLESFADTPHYAP